MNSPKPTVPQSLPWLLAGSTGLAAWGLLMLQAAAATGPAGYFTDLAQSPAHFLAWLALLVGLQSLVTAAQRQTAWRWVEVRVGVGLGLVPELLLTLPLLTRIDIEAGAWFLWLERLISLFQLPGRALTAPFRDFSRWAVGLTDPGSAWVARELAVLNLANVLGWVVVCLLVGVGVRGLGRAAESPPEESQL
ncbi:MAG: hypothetical protein SX243_07020 [Acidobacteriota bacterium]|nr:hypothetical protein [Acidobacteriota bacterium]